MKKLSVAQMGQLSGGCFVIGLMGGSGEDLVWTRPLLICFRV